MYSDAVDGLSVRPPSQIPAAVRRALDALADVLQVLPAGAAAADTTDVALVRSFAADMTSAPTRSGAQAAFTKQALNRVDAVLTRATTRGFAQAPLVSDEIRLMRVQIAAIDAERPLEPQLPRVLGALEAAEDALRTMASRTQGHTP